MPSSTAYFSDVVFRPSLLSDVEEVFSAVKLATARDNAEYELSLYAGFTNEDARASYEHMKRTGEELIARGGRVRWERWSITEPDGVEHSGFGDGTEADVEAFTGDIRTFSFRMEIRAG